MSEATTWDLAPAPESTGHIRLEKSYGNFINGKFQESNGGSTFKSINPATEKVNAEVTESSAADVDKAVKAARTAYDKTWSKMPAKERGKYIFRIARLLQEKAREFSVIESLDGGKPITTPTDGCKAKASRSAIVGSRSQRWQRCSPIMPAGRTS